MPNITEKIVLALPVDLKDWLDNQVQQSPNPINRTYLIRKILYEYATARGLRVPEEKKGKEIDLKKLKG